MGRLFQRLFILAIVLVMAPLALAQSLDVPIIERAVDDLDTCLLAQVAGLKADGDGFLAVRSGPSGKFSKIDELHNGDRVWVFETRGKWLGVVYGVASLSCSPISQDRLLSHKGKHGWIHKNWIGALAG